MGKERLTNPTIGEVFASKQPLKTEDIPKIEIILRSKRESELLSIRDNARSILAKARKDQGFAWANIREEGATMEKRRLWAPIYGNSVREFVFASQIIGLVKVIREEYVTDLRQEGHSRRTSRNFMRYISKGMASTDPRLQERDFTGMSVDLSKRIQGSVGAKEDPSLNADAKPWDESLGGVVGKATELFKRRVTNGVRQGTGVVVQPAKE